MEPFCVVYSTLNHYTSAPVSWLLGQSAESTEQKTDKNLKLKQPQPYCNNQLAKSTYYSNVTDLS